MDYIRQLNAFDNWIAANYCSASAQLLWYKLMAVNNSCFWKEWFTRTNSSLAGMMNVAENTMRSARKELKDKGLIDFIPGTKRGELTKYKLVILYVKASNIDTNVKKESVWVSSINTQTDIQFGDNILKTDTKTDDIININNKIVDVNNYFSKCPIEIITEYKKATNNNISELNKNDLSALATQYSVSQVIEAIHEAARHEKVTIAYIQGILKKWRMKKNGRNEQRNYGMRSKSNESSEIDWEAEATRGL
ncbi:MAG: primosome, DnaD subunit [Firmicutes bacterium]|nr:primosome, DnaD subunit [Bacillota bacterium]